MIMVPCRAASQNVVQLTWFRSIRQRVWCRGFWLRGLGRSCGKPWQLLPRGVCKDATCLGNLWQQIASYAAPRKTVHTAKWNKRVVPSTSIYCTCCCGLMVFYSADFATTPVVACQELIIVILFKATQIASTLFLKQMSGHLENCNKVVQVIHGSMPSILLKLVYWLYKPCL